MDYKTALALKPLIVGRWVTRYPLEDPLQAAAEVLQAEGEIDVVLTACGSQEVWADQNMAGV